MNLILHSTTECTFFSNSHGRLTQVIYIMDHKGHVNKFLKRKIRQHMLSNCKEIKLKSILKK
jgi:hypothetical protein